MAFKMAEGSIFAVLLRSPWWYSGSIGLVILAISLIVGTGQVAVLIISLSLPFFGIAAYALYKQARQPSQKRVTEIEEEARDMSATQIADRIAGLYVEKRFDSNKFKGNAAELELERGNRKILLSSKRFKAANTGIEPLKNLVAAGENAGATGYLYVALGNISSSARDYATANDIEIIEANRMAELFDGKAEVV